MAQNYKKKKPVAETDTTEIEKIREELNSFKPQTDLGKTLLEISKKGLESGVSVLDADEIMAELGRAYMRIRC